MLAVLGPREAERQRHSGGFKCETQHARARLSDETAALRTPRCQTRRSRHPVVQEVVGTTTLLLPTANQDPARFRPFFFLLSDVQSRLSLVLARPFFQGKDPLFYAFTKFFVV